MVFFGRRSAVVRAFADVNSLLVSSIRVLSAGLFELYEVDDFLVHDSDPTYNPFKFYVQ